MKKVLSLILAVVMLSAIVTGCTTLEKIEGSKDYDKGAIIDMYLSDCIYNFDPHLSITDESMLRFMSLIFEGLTRLDEDGEWQNAMMKEYRVDVDDEEKFSILVTLNNTRWTDGRTVQAADFVYSWKRLLDPETQHEAASLLYDIKNARACKNGDATVDDLGIAAVDTYVLEIEFEKKVDLDKFFANCSSIALVPLREDIITRYGETWAKKSTSMVTNGPFAVKEIIYNDTVRIERSGYYFLDAEKNEYLDKYVIPFRLLNKFSTGDAEAQLEAFNAQKVYYTGNIPLSKRAEYKDDATVTDMMVTHSYLFNTENELFEKPEVRRALSLAIDREKVVEIVTFAKPATGYIPYKVFDSAEKTDFRTAGGELISSSANVAEAKKLLESAGVRKGSFTITVRNSEVDVAIAEYLKDVWTELGFTVKVDAIDAKVTFVDNASMSEDIFQTKYDEGDFDVIAFDMTMLAPDAFSALSQFALKYSGNGVDMNSETYDLYGHVSGYNNPEYDALIDSAYAAADYAERIAILHEAEKALLDDMPVIPVVFLQDAYLAIDDLSGIKTSYYGTRDFRRTELKDYMSYKAQTEAEE